MPTIRHPILGALEPSAPGFWEATVTLGGRPVTVDLTIDGSDLSAADIEALPQKLEDLLPLDRRARLALAQDAQAGDDDAAAVLYVTHHQTELSPEDFERLFGTDDPDLTAPEAIIARLILVRVGFYPEDDERQILLDYSIDPDATDYLLCVSFDSLREPTAVDLES